MIEAIDREQLLSLFGDESFVDMIINKVAEDTLAALERLKGQKDSGDYKNYAIDAHGIKGMMASIYYEPLREHAKQHEFAAKEGRIEFINEDFDAFVAECTAFCNEILGK